MRIGIDCRTILDPDAGERAGVGHYTYHLVRSLLRIPTDHRFVLFMEAHTAPRFREEFAEHGHAEVRTLPYGRLSRMVPFFGSHAVIADAFRRAELDLLHAPANVVPLFYRGRTVVTIHDLAIYRHPEWFPSPFPGAQTFSTRIGVPHAVGNAAHVVAVSHATKRAVMELFGVPEGRVTVVHEGVDLPSPPEGVLEVQAHARAMGRFGIEPEKYVLSLGTVEPRKNLATAVRAFAAFMAEDYEARKELVYVIAGGKGWRTQETFDAINAANAELIDLKRRNGDIPRAPIRHVGYVTAQEKDALYTHAAAFLFPSWEEGFGLPALEAMAYGLPVVASDTSSLPEVCGDSALLVPPGDARALQKALSDLWTDADLPYDLSERAMARASAFTWYHAAQDTLRVYEKAGER
jgi:glycosyltransferase involved in cell wall biosynthesis